MSPCIASIGKWHPPPAEEYASTHEGTYLPISSSEFGEILGALTDPQDLCDAFDVMVVEWNSPKIKNLNWNSLVSYMACGGGIVWEDPTNLAAIALGIDVAELIVHDKGGPRRIAFDYSTATCGSSTTLCATLPKQGVLDPNVVPPLAANEFLVDNNHIIFEEGHGSADPILFPFLRLAGADIGVVGLYGAHSGGGRIVLTGPDNNFHGDDELTHTDPNDNAHMNQYALLFNEIDWVRGQ
jgi:hypothetical protein